MFSSGQCPGPVPEQATVLDTKEGLVVITGCSHTGIVEMLKDILKISSSAAGRKVFKKEGDNREGIDFGNFCS